METKQLSKTSVIAGWVISAIVILFLLVDAGMKVIKSPISVDATVKLGLSADLVQPIGIILLICTILYIWPRTAIIGAILLTGYLGGAIMVMLFAKQPYYFPMVFGVLAWLGLYLRDVRVKALI
ncbi:MAG: DoxX family protein [Bacteroidota bacterium]